MCGVGCQSFVPGVDLPHGELRIRTGLRPGPHPEEIPQVAGILADETHRKLAALCGIRVRQSRGSGGRGCRERY